MHCMDGWRWNQPSNKLHAMQRPLDHSHTHFPHHIIIKNWKINPTNFGRLRFHLTWPQTSHEKGSGSSVSLSNRLPVERQDKWRQNSMKETTVFFFLMFLGQTTSQMRSGWAQFSNNIQYDLNCDRKSGHTRHPHWGLWSDDFSLVFFFPPPVGLVWSYFAIRRAIRGWLINPKKDDLLMDRIIIVA